MSAYPLLSNAIHARNQRDRILEQKSAESGSCIKGLPHNLVEKMLPAVSPSLVRKQLPPASHAATHTLTIGFDTLNFKQLFNRQ